MVSLPPKSASDVVVVAAARTPIGAFGGSFRDVPVQRLGSIAIRAVIDRAGIHPDLVDRAVIANCRQAGNGPNPARTAAVNGGIPVDRPVFTVNMACPSGLKAAILAAQDIMLGEAKVVVSGGMESMSTMPYLLKGARWQGFRSGDKVLSDSWSDAVDPLCGLAMGLTAENVAARHGISRDEQDAFALRSQGLAAAAREEGRTAPEIVRVQVPRGDGIGEDVDLDHDEPIRPDSTAERLARLKPAFKQGGSVTAGNACTMGDAAGALLLTSRGHAAELGLTPAFSIRGWAETAVEPAYMGEGPGAAIPLVLKKAGLGVDDVDFFEVNEAFAAQVIANEKAVGWQRDRVNVDGGAIALGHPTGFTGTRLLMTLSRILAQRNGEIGVASLCGGGGVTAAVLIAREG